MLPARHEQFSHSNDHFLLHPILQVDFGRMHGHYHVQSPFLDNYLGSVEDQDAEIVEAQRFAKWVKRIHAEYRSYTTGKEGCMLTDTRVMQLREIGFQFA